MGRQCSGFRFLSCLLLPPLDSKQEVCWRMCSTSRKPWKAHQGTTLLPSLPCSWAHAHSCARLPLWESTKRPLKHPRKCPHPPEIFLYAPSNPPANSVAYLDPGNWATAIEAGSRYGYSLVWVVVLSNLLAILLQTLSARLGICTGKHLAQVRRAGAAGPDVTWKAQAVACRLVPSCKQQRQQGVGWKKHEAPVAAPLMSSLMQVCRESYPPAVIWILWATCEISIVALDLTMLLGQWLLAGLLLEPAWSGQLPNIPHDTARGLPLTQELAAVRCRHRCGPEPAARLAAVALHPADRPRRGAAAPAGATPGAWGSLGRVVGAGVGVRGDEACSRPNKGP